MGRYYEKNREKILGDMRDRDHKRRATERIRLEENPEDKKVVREENRDKYYKTIENKQRKVIKQMMDDVGICPVFKAFLETNVAPAIHKGLPVKFLSMCYNHLFIRCANPIGNNNITAVDGANTIITAD